jgi:hypothetical protein
MSDLRDFGLDSHETVVQGRFERDVYKPGVGFHMLTQLGLLVVQNGRPCLLRPGSFVVNSASLITYGAELAPPAMALFMLLQCEMQTLNVTKQEVARFVLQLQAGNLLSLSARDDKYYKDWSVKAVKKEESDDDDDGNEDSDDEKEKEEKQKEVEVAIDKDTTPEACASSIRKATAGLVAQAEELRTACATGGVYVADAGELRVLSLVDGSDGIEPNELWATGKGNGDRVHAIGTVTERQRAMLRHEIETTTKYHKALLLQADSPLLRDGPAGAAYRGERARGLGTFGDFRYKNKNRLKKWLKRGYRNNRNAKEQLKEEGFKVEENK